MAAPKVQPVIPEALMVRCPDLPMAKDGRLPSLMHNHVEVTRAYHLCAQRHSDLVDVVRSTQGAGAAH